MSAAQNRLKQALAPMGGSEYTPVTNVGAREMTEERRLSVSTNGQAIGTLIEQDGIWAFEYDPAWCKAPDAFPLSPSLPLSDTLQRDGSTHRTVQWYFDNLLPEELMREVISKEQGVTPSDAFGLLEHLGAESAGSLVLLPPGNPPAEQGAQALSTTELSARIKNLPHATLSSKSPKRMSLAGSKHKMVVLFDPSTGELREPLKGSASSHILKPNAQSEQYPHSVINETFTMRLAQRLGLNVPPVYRLYVPEPVYIVERFDRAWEPRSLRGRRHRSETRENRGSCGATDKPRVAPWVQEVVPQETGLSRVAADAPSAAQAPSSSTWQRRHAIDACQLLDQPTVFKYRNATLDTLNQLIQQCRSKAAARIALFRWVMFNTLVGNSDSHLKNISFLVSAEGVQLAPFYDLLCTAMYHTRMYADDATIWPGEPLAIPLVGASVFDDVTRDKLVKTGTALGLPPATAAREVTKMVQALPGAADALITELEQEFAAFAALSPQRDAMIATQGAEAHLLRGVRGIDIAEMLRRVG